MDDPHQALFVPADKVEWSAVRPVHASPRYNKLLLPRIKHITKISVPLRHCRDCVSQPYFHVGSGCNEIWIQPAQISHSTEETEAHKELTPNPSGAEWQQLQAQKPHVLTVLPLPGFPHIPCLILDPIF